MGKNCSVIFAGGKTGGHLFPGVAVAEGLNDKYGNVDITFIGLRGGLESRVIPSKGWNVKYIPMITPRNKNIIVILKFLFYSLPLSFILSIKYIIKQRPLVVIGLGGYPAFPVVIAAKILFVKTVLMEQNVDMGLTNRILSKFVDKIFVSYSTGKVKSNVIVTGNPTRSFDIKEKEYDKIVIGVLGGSQGAVNINKSIIENLDTFNDFKDKILFIHQTGKGYVEKVKKKYTEKGFNAIVTDFIDDMGWFYGQVDILISRAGATTISELIKVGKGAVFIPFPYATNNHQEKNARYIVENGGGFIVLESELESGKLFEIIRNLLEDSKIIDDINLNIRALQGEDAIEKVINNLDKYLRKGCLEK